MPVTTSKLKVTVDVVAATDNANVTIGAAWNGGTVEKAALTTDIYSSRQRDDSNRYREMIEAKFL